VGSAFAIIVAVISRIEALNYRCLKQIDQALGPFEILVGANASGKSSFLDVIAFLGDLVRDGLEKAVEKRTTNFHDLVWGREGFEFSFAINGQSPSGSITGTVSEEVRYEVSVCLSSGTEELYIGDERLMSFHRDQSVVIDSEIIKRDDRHVHFSKGSDRLQYERAQNTNYSALNTIPIDAEFPAAVWLRELLKEGVQTVALDARDLAKASPPARKESTRISGTELARSVLRLKERFPSAFDDWIRHIRTALPNIRQVDSILREDDKHRYVMIEYENGLQVPSWMLSEGTLRLLALTILAYLPDYRGVYLVEEPENGVHPGALETIYQSLSSDYEAQVLVASHSPILLSMAQPEQLLCFSMAPDGTRITRGSDHPALQDWRGEVSLGTLVASGILG
jgi:predicted ATPase